MMKLKNNKGITLIELVISIALISVVIMFLFRLIVDVRYGDNSTDFNRENQQKRALIIKTIQQDFLEKKLIGISAQTPNQETLILNFAYASGTGRLVIGNASGGKQSITYTKNGNETEKWTVEKANNSSKFNLTCARFSSKNIFEDIGGEFFSIKISIPMEVSKTSKNYIDDLELFYIGEKKDINASRFPNMNSQIIGGYNPANCG